MITYIDILTEDAPPTSGYSGIKRSEIGQGYGGLIGGGLGAGMVAGSLIGLPFMPIGGALGSYIGGKIGKNMVSDPNKPIDEKSIIHRFGAMVSPHASGPASIANAVLPGLGTIGSNIYNATDGNAKKLGYGTTGRVFSAFTPLTALTVPKIQQR